MISYLKRRRLRKQLKEYLHMARHARHMREDIADPKTLEALAQAEETVREIERTGEGDVEKAVKRLEAAADKVYPSHHRTGVRENVEVVIVALGAAMAIRAFFFQPFKIPTGSMQPTLNGIRGEFHADSSLLDQQPFRFVKWLVTGTTHHKLEAKAAGRLDVRSLRHTREAWFFTIAGVEHKMPDFMFQAWIGHGDVSDAWLNEVRKGHVYQKGDVIWQGHKIAGDHILVNKMKYNFMRPERGDIAVFDTRNVNHPDVMANAFYIKRMVGLPGEKIRIQNRRLVADGQVVDDPVFRKMATDPIYSGGHNVTAGSLLENENDFIQLAGDEYLMMGDNTKQNMSLDGRFFGGVPREDFQGPAFFVYWPFREHWGLVE